MKRFFITTIILSLVLGACSTGKKAYEKGDYYNATLQAVKRLRSNPESKKALKAVEESYPMAISYFQSRIDYDLSTESPFRYTDIAENYEKMNRLSDEVSRCPAAKQFFPDIKFYTSELNEARKKAAEEQYNAGLENEKINTRLSWKDAYFNYRNAYNFVPGYRDVKEKLSLAKFNATLKVIVEPIPVPRNYQLTSDFFLNQVIDNLVQNKPNEFVEYYSPEAARNADIKYPDQVLQMNFDEFVIGQMYDKETIQEFSRDSVEVGSVNLPDGTKKIVYNTVKAKLSTYRREVISKGLLNVTIIDFQQNRVLSQRKFQGQFTWFTEWASFNGDERALNKQQLALCSRKPVMPPGPQDLFIEFTKPIYDQLTPYLRSFFRDF